MTNSKIYFPISTFSALLKRTGGAPIVVPVSREPLLYRRRRRDVWQSFSALSPTFLFFSLSRLLIPPILFIAFLPISRQYRANLAGEPCENFFWYGLIERWNWIMSHRVECTFHVSDRINGIAWFAPYVEYKITEKNNNSEKSCINVNRKPALERVLN